MAKRSLPAKKYPLQRTRVVLGSFSGVDLSGERRLISARRSPRCVNLYKKYADGFTDFLETRPGFTRFFTGDAKVHGLFFWAKGNETLALIHCGSTLYRKALPDGAAEAAGAGLAERESLGFVFGEAFYLLDGAGYWRYDGAALSPVEPTVPVTTIGRAPEGGGTAYQGVNLLTARRINSFRGDGKSRVYALDAPGISPEGVSATVDGEPVSAFTVDAQAGTVTFETAPTAAAGGDDNVRITFSKGDGALSALAGARLCCLHDNRVFLAMAGNRLIHSELMDPAYFAAESYYEDGAQDSPITGLFPVGEALLVLKRARRGEEALYRHTPELDYTLGRIYPATPCGVTVGCVAPGKALCFLDDPVYLSARGLEGINALSGAARSLGHRSTLIDPALSGEDLAQADLCAWGSYLCLLAGNRLFLADGRAPFRSETGMEYEWFVWEGLSAGGDPARRLAVCDGELYFITEQGKICRFGGTSDEGAAIESVFETRSECAGDYASRKSVRKKGARALFKMIPNSTVDISYLADGEREGAVCSFHLGGLSFSDLDFSALSFSLHEDNTVPLPLRVKDFRTLRLRFSSRRAFGLGSVCYNVERLDYTK